MLYWLFTTYRNGLALVLIGGPFLCAALPATFAGAYLLGSGGLKTTEGASGPRQKRIALVVQLIVGLAVFNLGILLVGFLAVEADYSPNSSALLTALVGPQQYSRTRLLLAALIASQMVREQIRDGGQVRELIDRLRDPSRQRQELGSAHFCYPGDFNHLAKEKPDGLKLLGAYYGKRGRGDKADFFYRLDAGPNRGPLEGKAITFSFEDQARGIAIIGPPGTGKSQAGILPIVADTMKLGQSVIVIDPMGELSDWVLKFASVIGHLVAIHDPTDPTLPRFNLAADIKTVADAQAIARVMVTPGGRGGQGSDGGFWNKATQNLMASCLLRFDNLGDILLALNDIKGLAEALASADDEARLLAGDFIHSALETSEQKLALNIASSLKNTSLVNWAAPAIREATSSSDFSAQMLVDQPGVFILRCPGRYRGVYGAYLGAVLQKIMQDLDTIGELNGGPLPRPVKVVLDEFPALGKLDPVVTAVNLVRKRQISIVIAAQTLAQLEMTYGTAGKNSLLTGMATQIYFGSCGHHTAQYVSQSLGKATEMIRQPGTRADGTAHAPQHRQRDLMTPS